MTVPTTIRELAERYDALLFDSYGVLVNESHGLPGARELIDWLERSGTNYLVVTNDASRSIESRAGKFAEQGVPVPVERIVNSGCLVPRYFSENGLSGARTVVLGGRDAVQDVVAGGADVLPIERMADASVFVLADVDGFDWKPALNLLLTTLNRKALGSEPFRLLLPNPDLIYSSGEAAYDFAAAALAEVVEAGLRRLFGERAGHAFVRLGKPFAPIFDEAMRRAGLEPGSRSAVMIGDQLETDIAGAVAYGIDSAMVTTGIGRHETVEEMSALPLSQRPDYMLGSLRVD